MSSLDKALQILSLLSPERPIVSVSDASQQLGMPKSSASRLMKAMAEAGLLEQPQGGRGYMPGLMAFQLGNIYQRHLKIIDLVDGAVKALVERYGLTGYVGVLNGTDVVLISVRQGSYPVRLVLEKGTRIPAHVTAIGIAMMARRSDAEIRQLFPTEITYTTTNAVTSPDEIIERARRVRETGYASVEGITFPGFNAMAAAVESPTERQLLGFSLSFPQELLGRVDLGEITRGLISTAHDVGLRVADAFWMARSPDVVADAVASLTKRSAADRAGRR